MAASAVIQVTGQISGSPSGGKTFGPFTLTSAAACAHTQEIVLQLGANTITLPTLPAPTGCIIVLPSANTAVVTLKGVTGDTGIAIGKTGTTVLTWDPTALPTSFVLTSASLQTTPTEISYF